MSLLRAPELFAAGLDLIPHWVPSRTPVKVYKDILQGKKRHTLLELEDADIDAAVVDDTLQVEDEGREEEEEEEGEYLLEAMLT